MKDSAIPYGHISLRFEDIAGWKVAIIRLVRPDVRNCITAPMAEEIRDACQRIREDDDCRLVTVTGSGQCFSSGRAQLCGFLDGNAGALAEQVKGLAVAGALASLPIPVIVAVNGNATGHGLELALAGDLRVSVETAQFALWEPGQPALPWDGGTQRLPRLVGQAWALDLALTGRRLSAAEALRIGLVNRVVPAEELEAATLRLAESVLASAPVAARFAKEAVRKGLDLTLEQGFRLEADLSVILQSTNDRAEGIVSFMERRQPGFSGS